ncbi:hypothetical protein [Neisseria elongata]|uniref:Uncharacterized protein n=1 Tax=Neisseria elongata subsp. nitroreducens TaxID=90367 RepID=A0A9X0ZTM7_NEIEL|nr:hypothetical protein [Neisseria elongata]MBS9340454.1 hypothetical protein [Neisseria elongata subsp. nitroreducens]
MANPAAAWGILSGYLKMMKAVFAEIVRYFSGVGGIRESNSAWHGRNWFGFLLGWECAGCFWLSGSLLASQKLGFLWKLR